MTIDAPGGVAIVETTSQAERESAGYVDWGSIIAGIVFASAISLVLITFGSAVGLNFVDFNAREGAPAFLIGIGAASWFLWVQISSFMAGGYLTGRLRRRHFDASEDESDMRDGAHGLLVWGGAMIIGAVLAISGIGAAASTAGNVAATATLAASNAAEGAATEAMDPNAYFIDTLFRGNTAPDPETARAEAGRIFAQAALGDGTLADEDRTYLANVVAANTGLTPEEAQARVDQVAANIEQARQEAVEAARIARNTAIIAAFLLAASSLVSAIGAYWAAQKGGNHRDNNTVFADVFRRF
ncbi:TerB family tellurite resistance protein [Devosia sp. XJ19-1]|uniref:TerB family tellurite resistance protein n=1 Tax=Devosia ureilytica TaxID=2952754 RepID=A0A9Q4FS05_9HYPH|nr:TerB family tellurite resistance protein [Devosia ureilytica]MCP8883242.1 TerB family tellurite resistance protein [Devosia ureilytica]MCP8886390.1 TerB family tellurite resistance protein [Devosia ureilytica]